MNEFTATLADVIEAKEYTAWELAIDHWWVGQYVASTGRAYYHTIHMGSLRTVQLWRYIRETENTIETVRRYVPNHTPMRLVRIDDAAKGGA